MRRVNLGLIFIIIGMLILASEMGWLQKTILDNIFNLWPILLIGIGLAVISPKRQIFSWIVLSLLIMVVIGTLESINYDGRLSSLRLNFPQKKTANNIQNSQISIEKPQNTLSSTINLNVTDATITLNDNSDKLVEGNITSSQGRASVNNQSTDVTTVVSISDSSSTDTSINLNLNRLIPYEINLNGKKATLNINGKFPLSLLAISTNELSGTLNLPQPSGRVPITINSPTSNLKLTLTANTGLKITGPAERLQIDGGSIVNKINDTTWQTNDYLVSSHAYDITLNGTSEKVTIDKQ